MVQQRNFSRINIADLKLQIFKKLGRVRAERYFFYLKRLLSFKLSKCEFEKSCRATVGKENLALHNLFIQSILRNACLAHTPPARETYTGNSQNSKISNGSFGDTFPASPSKNRALNNWDRKFKDQNPLGAYRKRPPGAVPEISGSCDIQRLREQQNAPELISIGSKGMLEVGSVEDGEEVEQVRGSPCIQSRSPVRAPLGIPTTGSVCRKALHNRPLSAFHLPKSDMPDICRSYSELRDTGALRKLLERKVEMEGLGLSSDCVNLLNTGLDVFLKRLIKPCMDLARARYNDKMINGSNGKNIHGMNGIRLGEPLQASNQSFCASLLDFRVAMESNPELLGEHSSTELEKICLRASEEY
uniref:Transcriptional adapter 1 n=1 Tax=Anthurium amnicola TaxID=1678845 RepID=A0A1D1Z8H2_9ARAE